MLSAFDQDDVTIRHKNVDFFIENPKHDLFHRIPREISDMDSYSDRNFCSFLADARTLYRAFAKR